MKHEDESAPRDGSSPSEEEVRALLESLRVESPVPPALGARLEHTVASLQAERSRSPVRTPPVRRARPVRVGLALAAGVAVAVGAGGVVLPLLDGAPGGDSTAAGAASSAESSTASASEPPPTSLQAPGSASRELRQDLPRLNRSDFARQVTRELQAQRSTAQALNDAALPEAAGTADEAPAPLREARPEATRPAATCDAGIAPGPRQRSFLATLDDRPVLVLAGPARAVAYACAEDGRLRLTSRPEAILSRPLD